MNSVFNYLTDTELLALLIYGEARGEIYNGKIAVAKVVINRVTKKSWFGKTIKEVCLKKWQFSCFNQSDPNREKLIELAQMEQKPSVYDDCYKAAKTAINENSKDITNGATHYFNPKIVLPDWAKDMKKVASIGNHDFYK